MFGLAFLVVCGLYVWLALFVAKQVGNGMGSQLAKYATIAVFALVFTWDVIPGQLYFNYLCRTEGKVRVIKAVEVGKEYFLQNGQPDVNKLADRYAGPITQEEFSSVFHIGKNERLIQDKQTGEVLGTATDFHYRGGWLSRFLFLDSAGTSCTEHPRPGVLSTVWKDVFIVKHDNLQGGN